ncbi:MAG: YndJ family transporter [Lewinellaceae bacterium]|nr:YndJ family transporter [Lewinellaceae bacterium]
MKTVRLPWDSLPATAGWGAIIWLILCAVQVPDLQSDAWARLLLQLAVLVWVPLGLSLMGNVPALLTRWVFPAALAVLVSLQLPTGWLAGIFAVPWLLVCGVLFISGVEQLVKQAVSDRAFSGAKMFILIGGLSIVADRLALRPLGFDPAIILLTAVHFHYAGFVFLLLLGLAARRFANCVFPVAVWLALASVPLTALGITLTQLSRVFWVESLSAVLVVAAGWLGAFGYLQTVLKIQIPWITRLCWTALAFSLLFSMTLSLGYALRVYVPIDLLSIPAMRAWHGSVNAIGVAGMGLVGWYLFLQKSGAREKC